MRDVKINQAVIASCCHGRMEDMEIAARIVKGKKVAPGVRFWVAPHHGRNIRKQLIRVSSAPLIEAGSDDR